MKKILITGADGFFGQHLIQELEKKHYDYLGLVIKETNRLPQKKQMVADITNKNDILGALEIYKPDVIIHLAAIASVTYNNLPELYRVNVCGSENLLEAAKRVCSKGTRVIMISSAGVYGIQDAQYLSENLNFNPVNHYSYTKMIMEIICRQYENYLDIKIVRPFTVVGIGQNNGFFIAKLVEAFAERKPVLELGNIQSVRDYTDVELCANVLAELACRDVVEEKVINICTGEETRGLDAIEMLKELTGFSPEIRIKDDYVRDNEIWRLVGDNTKIKEFLGQDYRYRTIKEILRLMLKKYEEKKG